MDRLGNVYVTVTAGPSLRAPFAAVLVEWQAHQVPDFPVAGLEARLREFLPAPVATRLPLPLATAGFETVAAAIASALQDVNGANGFGLRSWRDGRGRCAIAMGYADPAVTAVAVQAGLDLATAFFDGMAGKLLNGDELTRRLQAVVNQMQLRQPDGLMRSLIRAASRQRIPVLPVAPASRVWQFGQGSRGIHFFEAASERDAMTGTRLARSKLFSNQLITALGLPGVRHRTVSTADEARRVAGEMGYPVVVKPVQGGKGKGVTAGIVDAAGIAPAFEVARAADAGAVLVEKHIAGDDHRLVALGGKFAWAVRRSPARVRGDGVHSIETLVATENQQRNASVARELGVVPIKLDTEAQSLLAAQGLSPVSVPAAGAEITLGRVANISRGGVLTDCTDTIHPDNRALAEVLARAFRLDAIGIDFLTPDITRSWREVACGVLEVNSTPGFSSDERAARVVRARFPADSPDGRIPTVVLVSDPASIDAVATAIRASSAESATGVATADTATLAGLDRHHQGTDLSARIRALLLDKGCQALVVGATQGQLADSGFPLDRCSLAVILGQGLLNAELRRLVDACADRVATAADVSEAVALTQQAIHA